MEMYLDKITKFLQVVAAPKPEHFIKLNFGNCFLKFYFTSKLSRVEK